MAVTVESVKRQRAKRLEKEYVNATGNEGEKKASSKSAGGNGKKIFMAAGILALGVAAYYGYKHLMKPSKPSFKASIPSSPSPEPELNFETEVSLDQQLSVNG